MYSLDSLCETQWYSMTKVCLDVDTYECSFFQSKENAGTDENHPSVKVTALQAINKLHFVNNADFFRSQNLLQMPLVYWNLLIQQLLPFILPWSNFTIFILE